MTHSQWRIYYHLVWTTEYRQPLILPEYEPRLYEFMRKKCEDCKGRAYAINGMPDHVHLIVTTLPTIPLAKFIKDIKGSSSRFMNNTLKVNFAWQVGYAAFTISGRSLPAAMRYVRLQKEHHQNGTIIPAVEEIPDN